MSGNAKYNFNLVETPVGAVSPIGLLSETPSVEPDSDLSSACLRPQSSSDWSIQSANHSVGSASHSIGSVNRQATTSGSKPTSYGFGSAASGYQSNESVLGRPVFDGARRGTSTPYTGCQTGSRTTPFTSGSRNTGYQIGSRTTPFTSGSRNTGCQTGSRTTPFTSGLRRVPGSAASSARQDQLSVIVAIAEGRGLAKGEVGMASIDLKRPVLELTQFLDSSTYMNVKTRLNVLEPLEVLMPNTVCDASSSSKLFQLLSSSMPDLQITSVHRKYFNDEKGLHGIQQVCMDNFSSLLLEVKSKYYCLAAAGALLKYVEFIQNIIYAPRSLRVSYRATDGTTVIDMTTVMNLELLRNLSDSRRVDETLIGVLNHTKTPMGARLLKSNLLQPPANLETINDRLDTVEMLACREELLQTVRTSLSSVLDIDHILSLCAQVPRQSTGQVVESRITTVIQLKHVLERVSMLRDMLHLALTSDTEESRSEDVLCGSVGGGGRTPGSDSPLSGLIQGCLKILKDEKFEQITQHIQSVIHDETKYSKNVLIMKSQRCFAIKPQIDGLLDVARRTYVEIIEDVDDRMKQSINEIYQLSANIIEKLLSDIRPLISCLYTASESIALLDMLQSFAFKLSSSDYVRPKFTDTMAVMKGRHPILEKVVHDRPVPNNTYASEESNFIVITGPNMSGKSTYLRQIALLQVMAQIGSFVPAEVACFRVADQIFSRLGRDDDIETNSSTFTVEMSEINYIIQNATDKSLIIIDELGRGTGVDEGMAICHAVCETLLSKTAFSFFVTHFQPITLLSSLYPNVENYHFEVEQCIIGGEEGGSRSSALHFTHALLRGPTTEQHYGLKLAAMTSLPQSIIEEAQRISDLVTLQQQDIRSMPAEIRRKRAMFKLCMRLEQAARNSTLDPTSLGAYMSRLKQIYLEESGGAGEQ